MSTLDPRYVIDYGKYVHPANNKNSSGSLVAFLAVYCGLRESDSGCAEGNHKSGKIAYRLQSGIMAVVRGNFEHPLFGWVPVFDFEANYDDYYLDTNDLVRKISYYEENQAKFLKRLVLGEYEEL